MIWHDQQNFIKILCHFPWCFAGILAFPGARNYIAISEIARLQNSLFFFLKISKEIGKAWCKSLTRAKRASDARRACEGSGKKTDCPFFIQWVRSDQGVQKCRRAVKNLFATPPSLWIWYTRWLISRENSACYCLHLASNLDAVSSNSKAVFSVASLWNVVYKVEDQKWVEVAGRQQSLCLLLEGGVSRKSRALRINCRISKHSSAILWVDG